MSAGTPGVLAYEAVGPADAGSAVLLCHGILGSGRNWRGFARRLVDALPGWKAILADLRAHGDSPPGDPPHTVAACADDVARLIDSLGTKPSVLVGHSFGGKVALEHVRRHPGALDAAWVLDSLPGESRAGKGEVEAVIAAVRAIPMPVARREDVVAPLRAAGLSEALARWMTTNLRSADGGYLWRFDLDVVALLLADYARLDLWEVVEAPRFEPELHIVRAGRSDRWSPEDVARLESLPAGSPTQVHVLPAAGHWLHADDPDGLLALMLEHW